MPPIVVGYVLLCVATEGAGQITTRLDFDLATGGPLVALAGIAVALCIEIFIFGRSPGEALVNELSLLEAAPATKPRALLASMASCAHPRLVFMSTAPTTIRGASSMTECIELWPLGPDMMLNPRPHDHQA